MNLLAPTVWTGYYFDARGADRHEVTVTIASDGLHIHRADGTVVRWSYQELHQTQGYYPGEHVRFEKGEGLPEALVLPEAGFLEAIRQVAPEAGARFGRPERQRHRMRFLIAASAGIIVLLAGLYVWGIPMLADFAATRVPVSWEERLGAAAVESITNNKTRCEEPERLGVLHRIIARLAPAEEAAPYQIRLTVVKEDAVNALAAPGGYLVVYSGLLEKTGSAEELAGVLAHEIEHVRLRHGTRGLFRQLSTRVLVSLMAGDSSGLNSVLQTAGTLGELRYSRRDEEAADRGGVALIQQGRIDPNGLLRFFQTIQKEESGSTSGIFEYFSSHPPTEERLSLLRQLSAEADYTPTPLAPERSWSDVARICEMTP